MTERLFILDSPGLRVSRLPRAALSLHLAGLPSHAMLGTSTMLWKLLREETPDYFGVAWDPPGPTFREQKFAAYKETRPAMPDDLRVQIPVRAAAVRGAAACRCSRCPASRPTTCWARWSTACATPPSTSSLVTADKDMLQLVGPRVRVLSTPGARAASASCYDEAKVKEKWGVAPEQIPDLLALMGDSIDNIPGVPGVGEKTAVKLIGQFGSVERLYENLTWCRASCARRSPPIASRRCSRASWRR